ncbi:hypothetical protein BGZ61DRAFT_415271 [Ilyonectria robusta]|uniref:uncharacterized protein n=1 Tax=Ilyonectria robusta TaxID=1079257 RepID=UPI001E8EB0C2|nr:uncharacterized protein BGZ61DRAFT_415271 [Ilyonectria robusta]KAH8729502.1 hypothetical protein BGZ61DRAFT_415271 [Ilyonectria robusta]
MPVTNGVETVLAAPEGYVVDFDHPQRQGVPQAYYVAGFGTAISLLFFAQRLYVKVCLAGGLLVDDFLLIVSWILALVTEGLCLHMFATGVGGVHAWEISVEQFNSYLLDVYLAASLYVICGSLAKIALLIFYLRLSPQRWFKMATWSAIVLISGYTMGIFIPLVFACRPIAMNWDVTITDGVCLNRPSLYIATAVANIASDLVLFILPIRMVMQLQIPRRQKFGLLGIFCIGSLTVVTSVVRVSILPSLLTDPDATWVVSWASVWSIVEANLIVTCASTPTLKKFFKHIAPKIIGESRYGSKTRTTENSQPPSRTLVPSSQSRRDRNNYSQFDPEERAVNDAYLMGPVTGRQDLKIMGGHGEEAVGWGDTDSEKGIVQAPPRKAILQTTTVTVEYTDEQRR